MVKGLVNLHSGRREHEMKRPKGPLRATSDEPHSGHVPSTGVGSSESSTGRVNLHSGYPGHARNGPRRPNFFTSMRPQFGHGTSVASSTFLRCSWLSFSAL